MTQPITVTREEGDLSREMWRFCLIEMGGELLMTLNEYEPQARATKRHKWRKSGPGYYRLRGSHMERPFLTEEPDAPEDVLEEALERFRSQIVYKKWKSRR